MAGLCAPLSTLRRCPRGHLRMTRGRCGSLLLHRDGLAPSTPCRSPGALRSTPINGHHQTGAVGPDGARSGDRENCKCNMAKRQSTFPASQSTTEKSPTGKSAKTCPALLTKIFRLTRRANHLYKLAPSHPDEGRIPSPHQPPSPAD